jgi:hypothetical protein
MESFDGVVDEAFGVVLVSVEIDDLDRHRWHGRATVEEEPKLDTDAVRPGLIAVELASTRHPGSGQLALAHLDVVVEGTDFYLNGEMAFRAAKRNAYPSIAAGRCSTSDPSGLRTRPDADVEHGDADPR